MHVLRITESKCVSLIFVVDFLWNRIKSCKKTAWKVFEFRVIDRLIRTESASFLKFDFGVRKLIEIKLIIF